MKKLLNMLGVGFLLVFATHANAQNSAPVGKTEIKSSKAEEIVKPDAKTSSTVQDIKEPAKPAELSLQKSDVNKPTQPVDGGPVVTLPKTDNIQTVVHKPGELKMADKPTTPTTSGFKPGGPVSVPLKKL